MSDLLRHLGSEDRTGTARRFRNPVKLVDFSEGDRPPTLTLVDGQKGVGTCLGCYDTPCAKKLPEELSLPEPFAAFPGNPALDVCPTQALTWDSSSSAITVDEGACIGCGLCVVRCPYGALYLTSGANARVETKRPDFLEHKPSDSHSSPERVGRIASSSSAALRAIPKVLPNLAESRAALLIRNALHELGVQCRVRRRGDTNVRIDAVAAFLDGHLAPIEIELSNASVESPRALLEDIAVMHSRYGVDVKAIDPFSIVCVLPNSRSDYYRVIDDIQKVLGLKCRTTTVAALLLLVWSFAPVSTLGTNLFGTDPREIDLSPSVIALAPILAGLSEPHPGALRPTK